MPVAQAEPAPAVPASPAAGATPQVRPATPSEFAAALLVFGATRAESAVVQAVSHSSEAFPVRLLPNAQAISAETDGLDPVLAAAYDMAAEEARAQGVEMWITSGYRTHDEQQHMWEDGIATYGSPDAARRWVLPPEESTHVSGMAVDVGPQAGAGWLEANGNRWGLCRTYDNEWWHFEIATLPGAPCPPRLPDASTR
ncbi:M15 family metallopeptidase [Nocardia uniformis]|uniref:M15 family metallopeptidase n=1 Tax=Nocardia uniformis TaxID=53432 RepID=A0A849BWP3_9NOCA|nr:M15 family metallopeptidase [Nocardia uniformis]